MNLPEALFYTNKHGFKLSISITQEMCNNVETETRTQSKSKLWYKYHAGRVTASRMRAACDTSLANPPPSLVKSVCNPDVFRFTTKATEWDCSHEHQARELYVKTNKLKHQIFKVIEIGLFILTLSGLSLGLLLMVSLNVYAMEEVPLKFNVCTVEVKTWLMQHPMTRTFA